MPSPCYLNGIKNSNNNNIFHLLLLHNDKPHYVYKQSTMNYTGFTGVLLTAGSHAGRQIHCTSHFTMLNNAHPPSTFRHVLVVFNDETRDVKSQRIQTRRNDDYSRRW